MKKMKNLFLLAAALLVFAACSETEEIPEFNDWKKRNTQFIDSIAKVARADKQGEWKIFLDRRIPDSTKVWDNDDYVYCRASIGILNTRPTASLEATNGLRIIL